MTENPTVLISLENLSSYDDRIKSLMSTEDAKSLHTVLFDATNQKIKFYKKENATLSDVADFEVDLPADLDATAGIASIDSNGIITIKGGITEEDGLISNTSASTAPDVVLAKVASTGVAEDIAVADEAGNFDESDLEAVLAEIADAISTSTQAGAVTCETSAPVSGDILRVYSLYQGVLESDDTAAKAAKKIIDINIPRDYLVKAAEVKTVEEADVPYTGAEVGDKYIDFTVNTLDTAGTETHLYIPVDELMQAISGSVGAEITVSIDEHNVISASVNKIASSKIIYVEADPTTSTAEKTAEQAFDEIYANLDDLNTAWRTATNAEIAALFGTVMAISAGLAPTPTEAQGIANNNAVESVTYDDGTVTVKVDLDNLVAFASSDPSQGTHKWVALEIATGINPITNVKYNGYALTAQDIADATATGCAAGSFVLYIRAEEVAVTPKTFTLSSTGYADMKIRIVVTA